MSSSSEGEQPAANSQVTAAAESTVDIGHYPLAMSCSYNGRFAVAYRREPESGRVYVEIYECESTGGSGWKLEDVVCVEAPVLPRLKLGIDLEYIWGQQKPIRPAHSSHSFKNILLSQYNHNAATSHLNTTDDSEIPSAAIRHSIKTKLTDRQDCSWCHADIDGHEQDGGQTSLVKIDWASTESGSHILMVCLANQVFVYSCVKKRSGGADAAAGFVPMLSGQSAGQASLSASTSVANSLCTAASSMPRPSHLLGLDETASSQATLAAQSTGELDASTYFNSMKPSAVVQWVKMRSFTLDSADDQQALPKQVKWVRDGLLVIGLSTEMQVYSQWSPLHSSLLEQVGSQSSGHAGTADLQMASSSLMVPKNHSVMDLYKLNRLTAEPLKAAVKKRDADRERRRLSLESCATEADREKKQSRVYNENKILEIMQDSGIFMQADAQFPTLPQYHPRQLLELLNSGKVNRVKAILMHLTRCIVDCDINSKGKLVGIAERKDSRTLSYQFCYFLI